MSKTRRLPTTTARGEPSPLFGNHRRPRPPCSKCNLPLLPGEDKCPRCRGGHYKDLRS